MQIDLGFLHKVAEITRQAGTIIEEIAEDGFQTDYKTPQDPVTTADHAANHHLHRHLLGLLPEAGWLSEETRDTAERLTKDYVWIVDPIDGTKEFVERVPQYAVSVSLAKDGEVILGVVYNPALDECFTGLVEIGAWLNDKPMRAVYGGAREVHRQERLLVLGSRFEIRRGEFSPFEGSLEVQATGSIAYKLALIAAGRANATFSLGPKNEWDIAAGVALIEAAGGIVTDKTGQRFVFNQKDTLTNGIIAATENDYKPLVSLIEATVGK